MKENVNNASYHKIKSQEIYSKLSKEVSWGSKTQQRAGRKNKAITEMKVLLEAKQTINPDYPVNKWTKG